MASEQNILDSDRPEDENPIMKRKKNEGSDQEKNILEGTESFPAVSGCYLPRRYLITFLVGVAMMLIYAMRTNVGVTVITILDKRAHEKVGTIEAKHNLPTVNWNSEMIGFLHSVMYLGHIFTQIPATYLSMLWPNHRLFGFCVLFSSVLNILLPFSIERMTYATTCIIRLFQGMAEGMIYPACYGVLRHWSVPCERGRIVSAVITGAYSGAILGFPMAGMITHYIGWQYVYFISAGACILWFIVWLFFAYEKPSHHPLISNAELEYLSKAQGQDVIEYENLKIPWISILTSLPVYAICLCHFARQWVFILMLTNEPLYLSMFGYSLAETGIYASLPHISKTVMSLLSGCIADTMLNRSFLTTTMVRKLLTGAAPKVFVFVDAGITSAGTQNQATHGLGMLSLCLFVLTLLSDGTSVIAVLIVGLGFFGLSVSGWQVNHYDLSTRHVSILVGISSTCGTIAAFLVPLVTGTFTKTQDLAGWNNVFYVSGTVVAVAVIFFLIFGTGVQQPWANPPENVQLIQKLDPLARKPYKLYTVQRSFKAGEAIGGPENESDKRSLLHNVQPLSEMTHGAISEADENLTQKVLEDGLKQLNGKS